MENRYDTKARDINNRETFGVESMTPKKETLEEFLARGGSINKAETPKYEGSGYSRYRMCDVTEKEKAKVPGWMKIPKKGKRK